MKFEGVGRKKYFLTCFIAMHQKNKLKRFSDESTLHFAAVRDIAIHEEAYTCETLNTIFYQLFASSVDVPADVVGLFFLILSPAIHL